MSLPSGFTPTLLDTLAALVIVVDGEGKIQLFNRACQVVTGYEFEEVRGRSALELLVPPDEAPELAETLRALLKDGRPIEIENHWVAKDGSRRLIAWSDNVVRRADGSVEWVIGTGIDVTEHRRLREQFLQAQKLESVARLAGGIAHDFNNLLTVVLSLVDDLQQDVTEGRPAQLDDLRDIGAAGRRAAELTRQLLAFARKQPIAPIPLDLNATVAGMEKLLQRVLGEDIQLRVQLEPALWPTFCDQGQIEQVIMNLAVNARDAMPEGGTLTVETRNVPGSAARGAGAGTSDRVALVVRDSGSGMSPDVKAHLFEPFFTTKAPGKGTGLGLATVYGIVRQSGGDVLVESEPGQGARFDVLLPRHSGKVEVASARAEPTPSRGTETILLVEDDPAVQRISRRALDKGGYGVLLASDGEEALALLTASPDVPRLMILDVVLPGGMNGRQLADAVRTRHPGMRVLFVSGYDQDVVRHHGVPQPGLDFLSKPFTPAVLLAKVREILDRAAA